MRTLASQLECSPMAWETWVQSQVESYQRLKKWYLMPPCLTLSIIRYGSRVKWSNPGKGVAPSPTPWCSSYRKGSLRVTLNYGRQLYLLYMRKTKNSPGNHKYCHLGIRLLWPILWCNGGGAAAVLEPLGSIRVGLRINEDW